MLSTKQIEQFHRDGYLRGGRILNEDQVETLRAELERVIRDRENPDTPQPVLCHNMSRDSSTFIWQVVNIWQASSAYRELISHPVVCEEIAQLTGSPTLRIWHDQIQYKPTSTGGVNMWHQDAPLWPILAPMTEVTAWIALDDVDPENGCMSMAPGSHRWGNRMDFLRTLSSFDALPEVFEGREVTVRTCPVRKGEVHFHHALTWHGSPANRSGRPRRAIALHFMNEETRFVASGEHVMKKFVQVQDGEIMEGDYFPLVWSGLVGATK